jgi:hypothetical protein
MGELREWVALVALGVSGGSFLISAASFAISLRTLLRGPDIRLRKPAVASAVREYNVLGGTGMPELWQYDFHFLIVNQGRRTGVLEQFPSESMTISWDGPDPGSFQIVDLSPTLSDERGTATLPLVVRDGEIRLGSFRLELRLRETRNMANARERLAKDLSRLKGFRVEYSYFVSTKTAFRKCCSHTDISFDKLKAAALRNWRERQYQRAIDILEGRDTGDDL